MVRLNIGCGAVLKEGYINVDLFVQHPNVVLAPADNLPYPDNSVDEVFSSHLLEHISHLQTASVLSEWRRVLKPGGVFNLVVPNLEWCMRNWLNKTESERWGFPLHTIFGLQIHPGEYHFTGFTPARVRQLLTNAGFAGITAESRPDPEHLQESIWASGVKMSVPGHGPANTKTLRYGGKTYRFRT